MHQGPTQEKLSYKATLIESYMHSFWASGSGTVCQHSLVQVKDWGEQNLICRERHWERAGLPVGTWPQFYVWMCRGIGCFKANQPKQQQPLFGQLWTCVFSSLFTLPCLQCQVKLFIFSPGMRSNRLQGAGESEIGCILCKITSFLRDPL